MYAVRATKKLLDRLPNRGVLDREGDTPTNSFGDWYATALFWRPQVAFFVNAATLLPVFVPLSPAATVVDRFPAALRELLDSYGFGAWFDRGEAAEMRESRVERTQSRSVLGSMNEFVHMADAYRWQAEEIVLVDMARWLAQVPCRPLFDREGTPERQLAALVRQG
jgi:hypothetical protein